jgi:hypothetical protein
MIGKIPSFRNLMDSLRKNPAGGRANSTAPKSRLLRSKEELLLHQNEY